MQSIAPRGRKSQAIQRSALNPALGYAVIEPTMKFSAPIVLFALCLIFCVAPCLSRAAVLDLAKLTCAQYENEVLPAAASNPDADSINTVMWLLGFSVAKSGGHDMYPEALSPFGFGLDNECKSNPGENMLSALAAVKPESKTPMDLSALECSVFASRHAQFARSDPESADTIMMWLFGFAVARSGSHLFDASARKSFEATLLADCAERPGTSLFDTLKTLKMAPPAGGGR
jgi:hypothetical protein